MASIHAATSAVAGASSSSASRPVRQFHGVICNQCRASSTTLTQRATSDKLTSLSRCAGCAAVYYCSKSCQRLNWSVHKSLCRAVHQMTERSTGTMVVSAEQSPTQWQEPVAAIAVGSVVRVSLTLKLASGTVVYQSFAPSPAQLMQQANSATLTPVEPMHATLTIKQCDAAGNIVATTPPMIDGVVSLLNEARSGARLTALIAADKAYGETGVPGLVPPKAIIIAECSILSVEPLRTGEHASLSTGLAAWSDAAIERALAALDHSGS